MRYFKVWCMMFSLLFLAGCQNQELLQCRQENQDLRAQIDVIENKLAETISMYNEMFNLVEKENEKLREQIKTNALTAGKPTQAGEPNQAQLEATVKSLREQLAERTEALLTAQKEIKKLQEKIKELEKKIKG